MKNKNFYKNFVSTAIISIIFVLLSSNIVLAQQNMADILRAAGETGAGFSAATNTSASEYIGSIIQYLLSFLGVIFICLTIYGGFLWMMASGDSEEITKAKDIITSSAIGLVIIISAYTLTYYLLTNMLINAGL